MRRLRQLPTFIGLIAAALLVSLSIGAPLIEAQEGSPPPLPPPGSLVDIGGWRLHLHCTGEAKDSQPTVILEPGAGDFSVEWSLVQPRVATFARVCSYDRAGDGWSDLGPHPRTMQQQVFELHALLEDGRKKSQAALVTLSRIGRQVIAARSGHHIQIEDPELVITSIRDVLAATRKRR